MLQVAFIGKANHTNEIISEILSSVFDAVVDFINPGSIFTKDQPVISKNKDLVIIDLNTSHGFGNAPDNVKGINSSLPDIPILVLDHHVDKKFIQPLIEAGASGIISNTPSELKLTKAVAELLDGNTFYDYPE